MNKKVIVLLADGFEDVETVTPIDYLRRAEIEVTSASISENLTVTSRWGVKLIAETTLAAAGQSDWDAVIVPGGMPGAPNLAASKEVSALLQKTAAAGKLVCAICASPMVVLAPLGLVDGKRFTCYPKLEEKATGGERVNERVVIDGNIITSQGPGTSGEFAIAIIEQLLDKATAKKIEENTLLCICR